MTTTAKRDRHSKKMAKAWERCEQFNSKHAIGTKVRYRSIIDQETDYDIKETTTRSEAWAMANGEPVVMIERKAGGVSLDHIEVIS